MLTSLFNFNPYINRIRDAKDRAYAVVLLRDAKGKFVGLVLTPLDAEYYTDGEIVPLARGGEGWNKKQIQG